MTWLTWRQYRLQALIGGAVLAAFAAVMLVTGLQMAAQWHTLLGQGAKSGNLDQFGGSLGGVLGHDFAILSLMAPALFGVLVGAPLIAHEFEAHTSDFAWAQSITRRRWLAVKIGWILLASAVWGGVISAIVTWWSGPRNAAYAEAFQPNYFDRQGLVPVGYAVFATALGIAAGAVVRRTLPAVAVVIGGFIGMRLWVSQDLRMHFMSPVTAYYGVVAANFNPPAGYLAVGGGVVNKAGQVIPRLFGGTNVDGVPLRALPASCQKIFHGGGAGMEHAFLSCAQSAGFRQFFSYQPISRYWAFQGIETGIYAAVAALLIAVTFVVVLRRDA